MSYMKEYMAEVKCAARAYRKLLAMRTEGWEMGWWGDSLFDGGEWSGAGWADAYENIARKTLKDVARKFDVVKADLRMALADMENAHGC
jgi:hypothetical protein